MAPADKPLEIFRKDYKPPSYLVDTVHLDFVLNEDVSRVEATMHMQPNYTGERPDLFVNGGLGGPVPGCLLASVQPRIAGLGGPAAVGSTCMCWASEGGPQRNLFLVVAGSRHLWLLLRNKRASCGLLVAG
jgi:hypothetical protein